MKTSINIKTIALALLVILGNLTFAKNEKSKKFKTIRVERTINAPVDSIWKVIAGDFGAIAKSHPGIIKSFYINGSLEGKLGAERQCNLSEDGSKYIKEKISDFDAENYKMTVDIYHAFGVPIDPSVSKGIYELIKIDENTTKLVMTVHLRTKPAFLGALIKGKYKSLLGDYLIAVEHHVKTGEEVNKTNFKEIKKNYKK